jgi:hypothetical protein
MLYAANPLVPWPEIPVWVMERLSNEPNKCERRDALGHNGLLCRTDWYALSILILAFFECLLVNCFKSPLFWYKTDMASYGINVGSSIPTDMVTFISKL